jgi:hypothetical protein
MKLLSKRYLSEIVVLLVLVEMRTISYLKE